MQQVNQNSQVLGGRKNRKLRAHLLKIWNLRLQGLTIDSIYSELQRSGIETSIPAVGREIRRMDSFGMLDFGPDGSEPIFSLVSLLRPTRKKKTVFKTPPVVTKQAPAPGQNTVVSNGAEPKSVAPSRADVDAFFETHVSNPLLRRKGITKR